jgi:spermidine/putrescine-binding protein
VVLTAAVTAFAMLLLTGDGWDKVVASAPAHVEEARRLVIDPLTKAQVQQLTNIGQRILRGVGPDHRFG